MKLKLLEFLTAGQTYHPRRQTGEGESEKVLQGGTERKPMSPDKGKTKGAAGHMLSGPRALPPGRRPEEGERLPPAARRGGEPEDERLEPAREASLPP